MPDIVLFHGYAETPDAIWFPHVRETFEPLGCRVHYETLPNPLAPDYRAWLAAALPLTQTWGSDTVIVGHSLGGTFAMRLLEQPSVRPVRALITVGSPITVLHGFFWMRPFVDEVGRDGRLRRQAARRLIMHAVDDPIVPASHAPIFARLLRAELRLLPSGGHFLEIEEPVVIEAIREVLGDSI